MRRHRFHRALAPIGAIALAAALVAWPETPRRAAASTAAPSAGRLVVDTFWSQSLGTRKRVLIYLPPSYDREPARRYPTAIYLHGLWGSEDDWTRTGKIERAADSVIAAGGRELVIVMPDGDDGWWTTWNTLGGLAPCQRDTTRTQPAESYCVPWPKYDEYVARDLVAHVDRTYRTRARRESRAIAGLSMGGFGAASLALRYPEVFAAAASHSGVLSPLFVGPKPYAEPARFAADESELREAWGPRIWPLIVPAFGRDTAGWRARDPERLLQRLVSRRRPVPALFIDVGREDFLVDQNRAFRAALQRARVPHVYAEWDGAHTWEYWSGHVGESLAWIGRTLR